MSEGLIEALHTFEFGVCLELTNLITEPKLDDKIDQAIRARRSLQELVPDAEIFAGVGFLNTSIDVKPTDRRLQQLSFIQPLQYEAGRLERAFMELGEYGLSENQRQLYDMIAQARSEGAPLEWLLNPTVQNWFRLRQAHGGIRIPKSRPKYVELVRVLKGFVLEEYGKAVYDEALPNAYTVMRFPHRRGDVDLVVAYDRKMVRHAIHEMSVIWLTGRGRSRQSKGYVNAPHRR